jgi:hypothetical protein
MNATIVKSQRSFACIVEANSQGILNMSCDELLAFMSLLEWALHFKPDSDSPDIFYKQIILVLGNVRHLITIAFVTNTVANVLIRVLVKLYTFLIACCKDVSKNGDSVKRDHLKLKKHLQK